MIKKEVLQKIIDEQGSVWNYDYKIDLDVPKKYGKNWHWEITKSGEYLALKQEKTERTGGFYAIKELFETKEEGEWSLEFENVIREERLDLPSWEEVNDDFYSPRTYATPKKDAYFGLSVYHNNLKEYQPYISVWKGSENPNQPRKVIFNEPLFYENYIEACRICKSLFLWGEQE